MANALDKVISGNAPLSDLYVLNSNPPQVIFTAYPFGINKLKYQSSKEEYETGLSLLLEISGLVPKFKIKDDE